MLDHLLRDLEIGDDAVAQRPDGRDVTGGAAEHQLGFLAHRLALVLALAAWFRRASWEKVGNPLFLLVPALAITVPVALILKEPNLGTAVITAAIGGAVMFAAGVPSWKFALLLPLVARLAYDHLHDYQRARIDTFQHPESDPLGAATTFGFGLLMSAHVHWDTVFEDAAEDL